MRLECVATSGEALPDSYLDSTGGYTRDFNYPLSIGGQYVVYAMTLRHGGVWYYLLDDRKLGYPVWYPAPLFKVVDGRLSQYWTFALHGDGARDGDAIFAFPEWVVDPYSFYDALSDGQVNERMVFLRYQELLDLEFASSREHLAARELGGGWLQCATCDDAWLSSESSECVRCPHCGSVQRNPHGA